MQPTFKILYFAAASSYTHKHAELLPAPLPAHELFDMLEERYPGIREKVLSSCAVSVGLEYIDENILKRKDHEDGQIVMIKEGDEVAIIPPVSSG